MRVRGLSIAFAAALVSGFGNVPPAAADPGAQIIAIQTDIYRCTFDIVFRVQDAGEYLFSMWDDGMKLAAAGDTFAAGATGRVRVTIGGPILQGAAGIGVYIQDASETMTFDADNPQIWSAELAAICQGQGKTFGAVVVSEEFPTGTNLALGASAGPGKPPTLSLLSRDSRISLGRGPGSPDDPVANGGSLRVLSEGGAAFDDSYALPTSAWKPISAARPERGYRFSSGGPIQSVIIRPGKQIKIRSRSVTLGHDLSSDPVAVIVELRLGERRYCFRFGGQVQFEMDQSFTGASAPADEEACPD